MARISFISVILSIGLIITGCGERVRNKTKGYRLPDEKIQEKRANYLEHLLKT